MSMEDSSSFFNYIKKEPLRIGPRIQKSDTNLGEHLNKAWSWLERQERSGIVVEAPRWTMPKKHSRRGIVLVVARLKREHTERNKIAQSVAASRMNNSAFSQQCDGNCDTMFTMPPQYGYAHEDLSAM